MAASTVWKILKESGVDPAPGRSSRTRVGLLHSQADALLACHFFETVTLSGARIYVLAVIEQRSRRIRILGATAHPTTAGQAARETAEQLREQISRLSEQPAAAEQTIIRQVTQETLPRRHRAHATHCLAHYF